MKILVVGATGTIGSAVADALAARHEVVRAGYSKAPVRVDLADAASIRAMYDAVGPVDAVVSAAGQAAFAPLGELTDEQYELCLRNKLMGQVNLVRLGTERVADGGSFTLTSGILARRPMAGGAAISMINSGVEGFARGAAIELPRGQRINAVAPGWVRETLIAMQMDPSWGIPSAEVAQAYVRAVEGAMSGETIDAVAP